MSNISFCRSVDAKKREQASPILSTMGYVVAYNSSEEGADGVILVRRKVMKILDHLKDSDESDALEVRDSSQSRSYVLLDESVVCDDRVELDVVESEFKTNSKLSAVDVGGESWVDSVSEVEVGVMPEDDRRENTDEELKSPPPQRRSQRTRKDRKTFTYDTVGGNPTEI